MTQINITPQWKFITWTCTTTCTYACSYCTPIHHDGKYRWLEDYSSILEFTNNFRVGYPLVFDVMGGEPTLWPKFGEFCNDLVNYSTEKTAITFTTNGHRTLNYWKKFNAPVDEIGFSFHPEFANEDHFINIFEELHQRYRVLCYILMRPQDFDRVKQFYYRLAESNLEINVVIKLISDWHNSTGIIPGYTDEMLQFSLNKSYNSNIKSCKDFSLMVNHEEQNVRTLVNAKKNNFFGWECYAGRDYLTIGPDGTVSGSMCGLNNDYGNLYNNTLKIPSKPIICTRQYCTCGTDIEIYKVKK